MYANRAANILFLLALTMVSSCIPIQSALKIDVPEIDTYLLDIGVIQTGKTTMNDVLKALGKPTVEFSYGEEYGKEAEVLGIEWFYPIRARVDRIIQAPRLKFFFDSTDVLTDWGFFHSGTEQRLSIIESTAVAKKWYDSLCNPSAWLEIDKIIKRNITTKKEVLTSFQWWTHEKEIPGYYRRLRKPIQEKEGQSHVIIFYVDRPSPIFIPPYHVRVNFSGEIVQYLNIEGYGGCK